MLYQSLTRSTHMVEYLPSRRPVYRRNQPTVRPPDDRERKAQARQEAEALFRPKPAVTETPVVSSAEPARLSPSALAPAQHETIEAPIQPERPSRQIPSAHLARIRAWVKYGMTTAQIAAVYGVDARDIARLLGKE